MVFDLGLDFDIPDGTLQRAQSASPPPKAPTLGKQGHYSAYIQGWKTVTLEGDGTVAHRVSAILQLWIMEHLTGGPHHHGQSELNDLAYQYKYDYRNRLIEKKIPGKDWESIVYDKLDRPVLTQDANLDATNDWLFTKYDVFGRVAYTGINNAPNTRASLQNTLNTTPSQYITKVSGSPTVSWAANSGTVIFYNNNSYSTPFSSSELYTINYYDTYQDVPSDLTVPTEVFGQAVTTQTKGLATVSKVRVLDTNDWITNVTYYDAKARPIYLYTKNEYLETTDITKLELDFTGKTLQTHTTHKKTGQPDIVTIEAFDYDPAGRLLTQTQKINNQSQEMIAHNHYDELGQLDAKTVGGQPLEDVVNLEVEGNTITKTHNSSSWNAGLATKTQITSDGYIEYEIPQTNKAVMVGLSPNNQNSNYNTIKYAIYTATLGRIYIYESGAGRGQKGNYSTGDTFRIERIGTTVYYKKNGTTFYTSSVASTGLLAGDVSIHHYQGKIKNLKISGASAETVGLQTIDYTYNIRGWLKSINQPGNLGNDLFGFELNYNTPQGPSTSTYYNTPLYNGNISHVKWQTNNISTDVRHYSYKYDAMNRFTRAYYAENDRYNNKYNAYIYNYDRNGNIGRLLRYGENPSNTSQIRVMDYLSYTYDDGNQLTGVKDYYNNTTSNSMGGFEDKNTSAVDYDYDANGNMTEDKNKNITNIDYNHLNLPTKVEFTAIGKGASKNISYVYDATGTKLSKVVNDNSSSQNQTLYAGNYIYNKNGWGAQLKFISQPEGYIEPNTSGSFDYVYQYKDHLGNVRLSYSDTNKDGQVKGASSTIIWEDNFESASGWDGSGNIYGSPLSAFDSTFKKTGNYSGRIEPSTGYARYTHSNEWLPINISEPTYYTISAWVFLEDVDTNEANIFLFMNTNEETGYFTEVGFTKTKIKGQWHYLQKFILVPENIDKLNFRIDNVYAGKVWFDNVSIGVANFDNEIVEENNYYPFGLKHKGYNNVINGTHHPYGYQGQEENDELGLNWLQFKWRNYDPAMARFMSIDPLAEQYVYNSTYAFAENKVISNFELEGLEAVSIHSKSFIPFKTLGPTGAGGSYSGDNRGFGDKGKSRISAQLDLNLSGEGITLTGKSATGADTYDSDGNFITHSEAAFEKGTGLGDNNFADGTSAATDLGFHISGNNDAIPGSPDIDVKGALGIGVFDFKDGSSTAVISGEIFGDKFPANETFMTDAAGTQIFLGVSGADGSPLGSLPGNNSRTMSTFTINVNFNSQGNATGVSNNGTNYSIADWNKRFTSQDAASDVSTKN